MKIGNKATILSIYLIFFCFGFAHLSVLSRLVGIGQHLGTNGTALNASATAMLLLCLTIGDVITSLCGSIFIQKYGVKNVTLSLAILNAISLIILSIFINFESYNMCLIGFFLFGLSLGGFNLGINLLAGDMEKMTETTMMPRFHSFYNFGAAAASLLSQLVVGFGINISVQYFLCAIFIIGSAFIASKHLIDPLPETDKKVLSKDLDKTSFITSYIKKFKSLDITIFLIALLIIANELTEGSGNNWLPKGIEDSFNIAEVYVIPVLWINMTVATILRFNGNKIADKFGKFKCLQVSFIVAICGVLVICLSPVWWTAYFGAILWGGGIALGYPLSISFVASSKEDSAFKTSMVAAIGGILNIATPPLLGLLGDSVGIKNMLLICIPFLTLGLFIIPKLKKYFG